MRVEFEKTECSRCGGSGHYSYNSMTGTRCFKCNGNRTQLSDQGTAAHKAWTDAKEAVTAILIEDVQVGMRLNIRSMGKVTITDVQRGREAGHARVIDGVARWDQSISLMTKNAGSYGSEVGQVLHRVPTIEEFAALCEQFRGTPGIKVIDDERVPVGGTDY